MEEQLYLQLSGLQHFLFCRRQWALIHIEQQWAENTRTIEGMLLHERAHDETLTEKRGNLLVTRGMPVVSHRLGVSGSCDVVEFHADSQGISLHGWEGLWRPAPVEYKRGSDKEHDADRAQLCAQALCLEEMLCCSIPQGSLSTAHIGGDYLLFLCGGKPCPNGRLCKTECGAQLLYAARPLSGAQCG